MAEHYQASNPVARMLVQTGLSERSFQRRFRAAAGMAAIEYVHALRLEEAKQMLEVEAGIGRRPLPWRWATRTRASSGASFKRQVGMTPAQYRRRFGGLRKRLDEALSASLQGAEKVFSATCAVLLRAGQVSDTLPKTGGPCTSAAHRDASALRRHAEQRQLHADARRPAMTFSLPAAAVLAASSLTMPDCSHSALAPTRTADSAMGGVSSARPEHVHDIDGYGHLFE